jgi:hypothetical protein
VPFRRLTASSGTQSGDFRVSLLVSRYAPKNQILYGRPGTDGANDDSKLTNCATEVEFVYGVGGAFVPDCTSREISIACGAGKPPCREIQRRAISLAFGEIKMISF